MNITSCPICGTHDLNCTHYFEEGIGVVEEYIDCKHCNYSFEYAYGAYRESFGRYEFHWGYSIFNKDNGEIRKFFMPIYKAKFMERRKWHKGLRKWLKRSEVI